MDPVTLSAAAAALTRDQVRGTIRQRRGSAAWNALTRLASAVRDRFTGDDEATAVLDTLETKPDSTARQAVRAEVIEDRVRNDPTSPPNSNGSSPTPTRQPGGRSSPSTPASPLAATTPSTPAATRPPADSVTPGASHDDEQPPTTASASESGTTAGRDNLQSAGRDLVGRAQIHYQAPRSVADPVFLGAYGAGLTRCLRAAGVTVVEINQPHPHTRSRRGKTDAVDAEAAARKVIFREATMTLKDTTGVVEAIRQLQVARHSAVKARSAELCQLGQLLTTAPAAVRETVTAQRKTLEGQATVCARLRPDMTRLDDPVHAARFALGGVAQRIVALRREIAGYDTHLDALVADVAPTTSALLGVGTHHTAQLLVTAGLNIDRLHSDGAFAHVCGADPIPASSGKTIRHRLNPGGDRDANRALHMIAVVRLRYCKRTRAYAERRRAEGKTNKETCAASSATSPDRSTAPSSPTSAHNGHV